jgi:hypothetical protein
MIMPTARLMMPNFQQKLLQPPAQEENRQQVGSKQDQSISLVPCGDDLIAVQRHLQHGCWLVT